MDALNREKGPPTPLPFICPCCNCNFSTSDEMIEHVKQSPIKIKTYSCSLCFLEFFTTAELKEHKEHDHSIFVSKYKCDECDAEYKTPVLLATHKKKHDEIAQKLAAQGIHIPRPSVSKTPQEMQETSTGHTKPSAEKNTPEVKTKPEDRDKKEKVEEAVPILDALNIPPVLEDTQKNENELEMCSVTQVKKRRGRKPKVKAEPSKEMELKDITPKTRKKQYKKRGRKKKYRKVIDDDDDEEEELIEDTSIELTSKEKVIEEDEEKEETVSIFV